MAAYQGHMTFAEALAIGVIPFIIETCEYARPVVIGPQI